MFLRRGYSLNKINQSLRGKGIDSQFIKKSIDKKMMRQENMSSLLMLEDRLSEEKQLEILNDIESHIAELFSKL